MAQLFTAQLDDWLLNIFDISDTINMAIARLEYMNTNGALLQHMGNRPREISFRSYWFGEAISSGTAKRATYANHYDFLDNIANSRESHTLIHPKYGVIEGYVESCVMVHDDTQDYVTIDIKFVEKDIKLQLLDMLANENTILAIRNYQVQSLNNCLQKAANDLKTMGASDLVGKPLDFAQKVSAQVNNVSSNIRTICNEIDQNLLVFDNYLSDVVAPFDDVAASVGFIADIPSRIVSSINSACTRILASFNPIINLPLQLTHNTILGMDYLFNNIVDGVTKPYFQALFLITSSTALMGKVADMLQTDEDNRSASNSREKKPAFDPAGNRINTVVFNPFLTVNDLENITQLTRKYAQKTLVLDRSNIDIKSMAAAILQYVNDVKLKRMTVKTITVNNMPIHQLLLQLGLSYEASDRVLALNPHISNPNFISGQVDVYVN